jgi:hypothetical protein
MTEQTARSKLKEWFDANGAEMRRATTAYEQRTLQDFADWLDTQQAAELAALRARIASLEAAVAQTDPWVEHDGSFRCRYCEHWYQFTGTEHTKNHKADCIWLSAWRSTFPARAALGQTDVSEY